LIQNDINHLLTQLENIAQNTSFNGQKLLSGAFSNKSFQVGANANQTVSVSIGSAESGRIGHISTANLALASTDGGDVQLTLTSGITGEKLTLNTVSVQDNNKAENGLGAMANEINRYSAATGIQATAVVQATGSSAVVAGTTGTDFAVNGVTIGAVTVQNNDANSALVKGINAKSAETGVTASTTNDGKLMLSSNDGRAIKVTGDLGGVTGGTANQFSTLGQIHLVQSGVSDFQISGIGAGATGTDFTISGATTTVQDSVVAAGSTIKAGSKLAAGSTVGGDVTVAAGGSGATQLDSLVKSGSTLVTASILVKGTQITGSRVVDSGGTTTMAQDSLLAAGTTLKATSVLGVDTVLTDDYTNAAGTTFKAGTKLTSALTLDNGDMTLTHDMTLKADNGVSTIVDSSALVAGSVLGADLTLKSSSILSSDMQLKSGSTLAANTVLLAGSTMGVTITQKAATDITTYQTTQLKAGSQFATASVLAQGSTIGASTKVNSGAGFVLDADQTLKAGSTLKADSILQAGTVLTQDMTLNTAAGGAGATEVSLKAGAVLSDDLFVDADTTLSSDLTVKKDSTIEDDSVLAVNTANAGTVALDDKQTSRLADINVLTAEGAQAAISIADSALKDVDGTRASLGAVQNQLSSTIANLSVTQTNVNATESGIRDVDFANEAGNFSRIQVLSQAGAFALSQANAASQSVLSLLQR
jgi:flagellin